MKTHSRAQMFPSFSITWTAITPFGPFVVWGQKYSNEENICIPIMRFQCKNNFEYQFSIIACKPVSKFTR